MALQPHTTLDRIFLQLKSKSEDKRYSAQAELHDLVVSTARGMDRCTTLCLLSVS